MNLATNLARIRDVVDLLKHVPADNRLLAIQNLCDNNGGRWDPRISLPDLKQPCLYEIQVFGVPAMAENVEDISANWLRAANNILEAETQGEAA